MIFMRRRPLMRAGVVGGAAYHIGKNVQSGRDQDAQQEAEIQDLQAQQQYAQAAAQNLQAAVSELTGGNQTLTSVAQMQLAQQNASRQQAVQLAQLAAMLNQSSLPGG